MTVEWPALGRALGLSSWLHDDSSILSEKLFKIQVRTDTFIHLHLRVPSSSKTTSEKQLINKLWQ